MLPTIWTKLPFRLLYTRLTDCTIFTVRQFDFILGGHCVFRINIRDVNEVCRVDSRLPASQLASQPAHLGWKMHWTGEWDEENDIDVYLSLLWGEDSPDQNV